MNHFEGINGILNIIIFFSSLHNTDIQEIKGLLLSYTRQMCCAMTFLEKKGYIHRDLAARNILVTSDGYTVKVRFISFHLNIMTKMCRGTDKNLVQSNIVYSDCKISTVNPNVSADKL